MGIYSRVIFPHLCDLLLDNQRIRRLRQDLLVQAHGRILEIGFGTGLNLPHYPNSVRAITAVDPNVGMHRLAQRRIRRSPILVDRQVHPCEHLPFAEASFDCVVSTFTLCSVADLSASLAEIARVLRPLGQFLYLEHGLSPDAGVRTWQRRLNRYEMIFGDGCRLDRDFHHHITLHGFLADDHAECYLPGVPRTHGYLYRGTGINGASQVPDRCHG
ncbi:MAG: class I SAM-dependent methyltransferase [Pirellulaceae bacterium]